MNAQFFLLLYQSYQLSPTEYTIESDLIWIFFSEKSLALNSLKMGILGIMNIINYAIHRFGFEADKNVSGSFFWLKKAALWPNE